MTNANPKSWTDQPDLVTEFPVVCRFYTRSIQIEVRKGDGEDHFISAGNLFGSQTIRCESSDVAFRVLNDLDPDKTMDLPKGADLV